MTLLIKNKMLHFNLEVARFNSEKADNTSIIEYIHKFSLLVPSCFMGVILQ